MANMRDHDRIDEIQAYMSGIMRAFDEVLTGLENLAADDPAVHGKLAGHLVSARAVIVRAETEAAKARAVGEERWRVNPGDA
jgi:hypothetical protein